MNAWTVSRSIIPYGLFCGCPAHQLHVSTPQDALDVDRVVEMVPGCSFLVIDDASLKNLSYEAVHTLSKKRNVVLHHRADSDMLTNGLPYADLVVGRTVYVPDSWMDDEQHYRCTDVIVEYQSESQVEAIGLLILADYYYVLVRDDDEEASAKEFLYSMDNYVGWRMCKQSFDSITLHELERMYNGQEENIEEENE